MKKSEIKFTVTLDENNLPLNIEWEGGDGAVNSVSKAVMIALWDEKEKSTMRMDLWTKDMLVDEMKIFFHQNLVSMADVLKRSTGDESAAKDLVEFSKELGYKLNVLTK